ncbi:MAG: ABC transporter permease [Roseburia sp.]|nr:ABC transporter permease [Roseburia sp.]
MVKLLRANLARLWKSKVFWLGFFVLTAFGILQKITIIQDSIEVHYLEEAFWIQALVIGMILSVFISLFVGSEYEYGTIRNKIISGHARSNIYFVNVLVCILAGWMMCLGCLISSLLTGVPFLGFFHRELSEVLLQGICVFALSAAYTAIYCFFAMLIPNRTITAIVCILLSFLLLFAGTVVSNRLDESEYYYIPDATLGIGEIDDGSHSEWIRNPDYLEGTKRRIYEIVFEVIPGGQSLQLSGMLNEHTRYIEMFSASLAWIVLSCGCGLLLFCRKDLN